MSHKTERGVFELRQGRVLCITDPGTTRRLLVASVECLGDESLSHLRSFGESLRLVLTAQRARVLGIAANGTGADVTISLDGAEGADTILELATGSTLGGRASGIRTASAIAAPPESAALALTRLGHLLPAVVAATVDRTSPTLVDAIEGGMMLEVSVEEVEDTVARSQVEVVRVAEAPVPLAGAESARFVFFREGGGFLEHVAVLIEPPESWPDPLPVRLHSACLTGDLFGSLRCDCGDQLRGSLEHFKASGGGVLVYLHQEGRGIGLGNKIRAYMLQDEGLDTVDADGVLGFGADERHFGAAVEILHQLGVKRVELLTNNPEKVAAVEEGGIEVVERIPIVGGLNTHNLPYVRAKADRSGHWLMEMLSQTVQGD